MLTPRLVLVPGLLAVLVLLTAACGGTMPVCSAATCAGCCDAQGLCQAGVSSSACGERGAACTSCGAAVCSLGRCGGPVSQAGGGSAAGGGLAGGGSAGGAAAGGAAGGASQGTACDRAASLIQTKCGAAASTVAGQCQMLLGSACATPATAWLDCLVASPTATSCVNGDLGSATACRSRYTSLASCLNGGAGGGAAGGGAAGGGSAGGSSGVGQPCPNTAPICAGTSLYCALTVTPNGTSDGVFASTGACRRTCSSEADCGALEDCCMLRNASATVCVPSSTGICDRPVSVCKANGQSCVNDTNCCSGRCSALFNQCEAR